MIFVNFPNLFIEFYILNHSFNHLLQHFKFSINFQAIKNLLRPRNQIKHERKMESKICQIYSLTNTELLQPRNEIGKIRKHHSQKLICISYIVYI